MCELNKKRFEELVNVEGPNPNEIRTTDIIMSNGRISLIKKEDGTFSLRNEYTGIENCGFLTQGEAEETYNDLICEE